MKLHISFIAIAIACLVASSSEAQVLFSENFTGQTPGATVSGFTVVAPTTATATLGSIVTNVAGNNAMNMYDSSATAATRVDEDFAPTSSLHLSLSFTRNANIAQATTTQALYVSLGLNGLTQTTAANRTLDMRLFNDGSYRLDRGFQTSGGAFVSNGVTSSGVLFDSGSLTIAPHTLDIYAYAATIGGATLGYTAPDAVARVLDPNSYAVYIDGALVQPSTYGLTANADYGFFNSAYYGANLGRATLLSSATAITGVDFLIDDVSLSVIPEPSTFTLLGAGGLLLIGALRRSRRSR
jgi:hypothetical protein